MSNVNDTIIALATAIGKGHRSIIRLSGANCIEWVASACSDNLLIKNSLGFRFYKSSLNVLEIPIPCYLYIMRAPASYTCEDMIEIHLETTSPLIQSKIITYFITCFTCRIAEPGEFTKRAYFNGRIDLIQAESVIKIINANSEYEYKRALEALSGRVSNIIAPLREELFFLVRDLTVDIDFDEDIEEEHVEAIKNRLLNIQSHLKNIASSIENEQNTTDEYHLTLYGPVNAGKSTIFNQLIGENRAIVSDIKGTTRDIIKHEAHLLGQNISLQDCPGWGEAVDELDAIAQIQSKSTLMRTDLVLCVLDNTVPFIEQKPLHKPNWENFIIIINKTDLPQSINLIEASAYFETSIETFVLMSGKNSTNELKSKIIEKLESLNANANSSVLSARQQKELHQAQHALQSALDAIELKIGVDAVEFEVRRCLYALSRLTGNEVDESILTSIFESFCIGK